MIALLASLERDDLATLRDYERRHANRARVLAAIDSVLARAASRAFTARLRVKTGTASALFTVGARRARPRLQSLTCSMRHKSFIFVAVLLLVLVGARWRPTPTTPRATT